MLNDIMYDQRKGREHTRKVIFQTSALIFCIFFIMGLPNNGYAQSPQEIAKKAFLSTVLLVMEDANGHPLSLGSGFFVHNGEIASNLHVIKDAARGYAKLVGQKTKYDIEGITAIDPKRDLVILKISKTASPTLSLGDSDEVQVGENIYVVGNPQGLEGTFSQGIVSSIREVGADKLLQITAPISPGSSGGPVLNAKGDVIGVSVATFRGGQNLNFAIPSKYLDELLIKTGSVKPLSQAKALKAQKSILSSLGSQSSEGVTGGQLTWDDDDRWGAGTGGGYTFSLRNKLNYNIKNIYCLVIFYDQKGSPIDFDLVEYKRDEIPAGLAKLVSSSVYNSVQRLTTPRGSITPKTRVEIRVLDFQIVQ